MSTASTLGLIAVAGVAGYALIRRYNPLKAITSIPSTIDTAIKASPTIQSVISAPRTVDEAIKASPTIQSVISAPRTVDEAIKASPTTQKVISTLKFW